MNKSDLSRASYGPSTRKSELERLRERNARLRDALGKAHMHIRHGALCRYDTAPDYRCTCGAHEASEVTLIALREEEAEP